MCDFKTNKIIFFMLLVSFSSIAVCMEAEEVEKKSDFTASVKMAEPNTLSQELLNAYEKENMNEIDSLIGRGHNINGGDKNGKTLAIKAAQRGKLRMLKFLKSRHADFSIENPGHKNALMFACEEGHEDIVEFLIELNIFNINQDDNMGNTALLYASSSANASLVQYLIEHGADVQKMNDMRETSLMYAAKSGNFYAFKYLVKAGANIRIKDCEGSSVLHWAAKGGNKGIIKYLIDDGLDINATGVHQETPLIMAAIYQSKSAIQILLDQNAKIDEQDSFQQTALMYAVGKRNREIVKLLIDAGCDIKPAAMSWAMSLARRSGNKDMVKLLSLASGN